MKKLLLVLAFLALVTPANARGSHSGSKGTHNSGTVDIYNSHNQKMGYVEKNGGIYDNHNKKVGYVSKDGGIYDTHNKKEGYIEKK